MSNMKKTYISPEVCINAVEQANIIALSLGVGANTGDMEGTVVVDAPEQKEWNIWSED